MSLGPLYIFKYNLFFISNIFVAWDCVANGVGFRNKSHPSHQSAKQTESPHTNFTLLLPHFLIFVKIQCGRHHITSNQNLITLLRVLLLCYTSLSSFQIYWLTDIWQVVGKLNQMKWKVIFFTLLIQNTHKMWMADWLNIYLLLGWVRSSLFVPSFQFYFKEVVKD